MGRAERRKGVEGEREVAALGRAHGFEVRGLEGLGDWLMIGYGLTLHIETKRQEVARPWAWWAQASAEAPALTLPLVAMRRNRSPWLGLTDLDAFFESVALAYTAGSRG